MNETPLYQSLQPELPADAHAMRAAARRRLTTAIAAEITPGAKPRASRARAGNGWLGTWSLTQKSLALVGGAAVIAVGAVTLPTLASSGSPATATHHVALTADYVKKQVEATLNSGNYVVEANSTIGGDSSTTWVDSVTGNLKSVDKTAMDTKTSWFQASLSGGKEVGGKLTLVDSAAKTVTTESGNATLTVTGTDPTGLKQELDQGQLTIAGKSVIDGQSVIDLRYTTEKPEFYGLIGSDGTVEKGKTVTITSDFWVNAQTFQVLKFVNDNSASGTTTVNYQWLPRTKALVAQVGTPQIPAGYRQISK
jgi:hypothetical protein